MKYLHIAFFLLVFASGSAHAAEKILDIQEVTSPGGIKAWLVEDHSVPVIAMSFGFNGAGSSRDPAEKQGLARLLSNTMDEGAGDMTSQEFQQALRDLVISLGFSTDRDHFTGGLKTLAANKKRAFELLALALTKPRFDEDPVNRMRAANQSRVRSSMTEPDWIASRLMNDRGFAGHPYAQNSGGTLNGLAAITPADLRAYHARYLGRNNLEVAVAGDMTKEELAVILDSVFGNLPKIDPLPEIPPASLQGKGTTTLFKKDIPQTVIEITQPGISRKDPDYQGAQVMNFILGGGGFGSRLTEEIREKRGLTYGIYSSLVYMSLFDGLSVATSTENKNAGEVLSLIRTEWDRMKNTAATEKELQDAKTYLVGSLPLSLSSTGAIAGLALSLQLDDLSIDYLERRNEQINATTIEDVQRIAKKILDSASMNTILVGSPAGVENPAIAETLPNVE